MAIPPDLLFPILAAPHDDLPRLVAADWMEENGDVERAKYIRYHIWKPERPRVENGCGCSATPKPPCGWCESATEEQIQEREDQVKAYDAWIRQWGLASTAFYHEEFVTKWERGFPSEIRCTQAQWVGGPCERCHGNPYHEEPAFDDVGNEIGTRQCIHCNGNGTGRTPGIAGRVMFSWPVTTVVLTDCNPQNHAQGWCWWCHVTERHDASVISREIWDRLESFNVYGKGNPTLLKWYNSESEAHAALSSAAIAFGLREAGRG